MLGLYAKKTSNIFTALLYELKVRHTKTFSDRYFAENPHKDSMLGLSKMLSAYRIENKGIRVKDKEKILPELKTPFIAYTGSDFVTVVEVNDENVKYIERDKKHISSKNRFIAKWTGVVLTAVSTENSIEPDYHAHRKQEVIEIIKQCALVTAILLLSGLSFFCLHTCINLQMAISLLVNISGFYVCCLLLLKQMRIQSSHADAICSFFGAKDNCNNLLETDAAKILGFSWSEIGLGYFTANLFVILFAPFLYPCVVWLNVLVLPFTLWSVWYQRFKAKQWCALCLTVLVVLWLLFAVHLAFGLFNLSELTILHTLMSLCLYAIPVLLLNRSVHVISGFREKEKITLQINSLKANEELFKALLKQKKRHEVSKSDSIILFGNVNAKNIITVITNPHCNPCAKMHECALQLLKDTNNGYCIQYILSSFNKKLDGSSLFFIYLYRNFNTNDFLSHIKDWYKFGKYDRENFYKTFGFDSNDTHLSEEYEKHIAWLQKSQITITPKVLFNGHELPDTYKIEDLKYFF